MCRKFVATLQLVNHGNIALHTDDVDATDNGGVALAFSLLSLNKSVDTDAEPAHSLQQSQSQSQSQQQQQQQQQQRNDDDDDDEQNNFDNENDDEADVGFEIDNSNVVENQEQQIVEKDVDEIEEDIESKNDETNDMTDLDELVMNASVEHDLVAPPTPSTLNNNQPTTPTVAATQQPQHGSSQRSKRKPLRALNVLQLNGSDSPARKAVRRALTVRNDRIAALTTPLKQRPLAITNINNTPRSMIGKENQK